MEKKKKSLLSKLLKVSGISLVVILIALICIPIFFKGQIKDMVLEEANKSLTAKVELGDFDLTLLSTFPNLTVQLLDTKITGTGDFEGLELLTAKNIKAQVKLWDVISGDKIAIKGITLVEPRINVKILPDGKANYDITIPDSVVVEEEEETEPSNFQLSLQKYEIIDGYVKYDDQQGVMYAEIVNLNHEGKGDLTADIIDFETLTNMDELTFAMDGMNYLTKVKTSADINLKMEFTEKTSKFTLQENKIGLNNLNFAFNGFYEMLEGYDNMDLTLDASKASFKDLLSLIPAFYIEGYENMVTNGTLAMNGVVKGRMDDVNMPGWDFGMQIDNATIKYPDVPGSINNIKIKAGSKFKGGANMDLMTLDIPVFHADFVGNMIDATLKMSNPMTDPLIQSKIMAKVDLATLGKVMPMPEGESYSGKLDANISLNGRMSAIEKERYEEFEALGTLTLMDMVYKESSLLDDVNISKMVFEFSPKNLSLKQLDAQMGRSDFKMDGTIDNYLGYLFRDELLAGNFNFSSNFLDIDRLMGTSETPSTTTTTTTAAASATEESSEPVLIPANIDFKLNTKIMGLAYDGMDIKNVTGDVRIKDQVAYLEGLNLDALGGNIGLTGSYNTTNHDKPALDFGYKLKDIDVEALVMNFTVIGDMVPVSKFAKGSISSNFSMTSFLTPNLDPIMNSLSGNGDFFTRTIEIVGFKPLEKLGSALNMDNLKKQSLKNVKVFFEFADGKLTTKPFDLKIADINTNVSGVTTFDQDIDYSMLMSVPKAMVPQSMIKAIEAGAAKINGLAPKLNIAGLPDFIPVKVKMLGKVTDPKVTTDFKEALMAVSGNLKDNLKNAAKDLVNEKKDSLVKIGKDKVEDVKEDMQAKKQEIIDNAQVQANKVKAESAKAANAIRTEGDKQAKALMNEAGGNPIKKKAAELAGNKLKKEAEEKALKVEKEGKDKADNLMKSAQEKADKL